MTWMEFFKRQIPCIIHALLNISLFIERNFEPWCVGGGGVFQFHLESCTKIVHEWNSSNAIFYIYRKFSWTLGRGVICCVFLFQFQRILFIKTIVQRNFLNAHCHLSLLYNGVLVHFSKKFLMGMDHPVIEWMDSLLSIIHIFQ